jgi:hypothetical protein
VPTRCAGPGMLHDWLNALCWLRWPRLKATMNRLQAEAARASRPAGSLSNPGGGRGRLRDAITLFDESGALFVSDDATAISHWRSMDWHALFVAGREGFEQRVAVLPVGHALLEKLLDPYKAICAHALSIAQPAGLIDTTDLASPGLDRLDRLAAQRLSGAGLRTAELSPLPVLGIPGWWPANSAAGFYNDPMVFRTGRQRSKS